MIPLISVQYTAARAYFGSIIGLLVLESLCRLPYYLSFRIFGPRQRSGPHWKPTVWLTKVVDSPIPSPILLFQNYHVTDAARFGCFVAINVIFSLNHNEYSSDYTLYGWLTIANGGLALLLTPRTNLLAILGRIPSPVLLQYHRWIGTATVAHATVHISYNIQHYIATDQLASSFIAARIRVGIMSWICLVIILITAFPLVRRKSFEIFYYAHFLFFVFMVGALYHTTNGPEFLLPGFSLWVVDRAIRFIYNFRRITVHSVSYHEGGLTKFEISGFQTTSPGQIVFAQIPSISFFNWHPFTVASAANHPEKRATFAIRSLGSFTKHVQQLVEPSKEGMSQVNNTVRIRVDGPYGVGKIQWGSLPVTVLVAGGIGITPGISIASTLIRNTPRDWHNHNYIHLLWIVKEECHIDWWKKELQELIDTTTMRDNRIKFYVTIHVTNKAVSRDGANLEEGEERSLKVLPGRPVVRTWLQQVKDSHPGMDAALNICGPRSLITETRKAAVKLDDAQVLFHVEEEVFEL